jgi:hypothetical protein
MIGYRFLDLAEEEMTEPFVFYQASSNGLEVISLTMYSESAITFVSIPISAA